MINIPQGMAELHLTIETRSEPTYVMVVDDDGDDQDETEPWYTDIYKFCKDGEYPPIMTAKGKRALRLQAANYCI